MGNEAGLACWNGRKLSPSNRINPFSVPIHRYPSAVCAMAVTAPAVNPLSLPHRSRMYCEIMRFGSIACPGEVKNMAAIAAITVLSINVPLNRRSRKVLKFLNYNLILFLQRILFAGEYVEQKLERFRAG